MLITVVVCCFVFIVVYFPVECIGLSLAMSYTSNSMAGLEVHIWGHVLPPCHTLAVFSFSGVKCSLVLLINIWAI